MSLAGRPDRRSTSALTRRSWLRLGALGATGLSLPRLLRPQAPARPAPPTSARVLLLRQGGPSQLDIWDPKPDAPEQVRGPFRPIDTSVPGIRIVEHLPRLARMAHRFTVVRSMTHANVFHNA